MRTKTLIALAASGLAVFLVAAPTAATWPEAVQGDSIGIPQGIAGSTRSVTVVGADGSVYLAGTFKDTATFGPLELTSIAGSYDVFVAKYSDLGDVQWVLTGGGPGVERLSDLAIDEAGHLYVSGTFTDTAVFGATQLTLWGGPEHANPRDIFVAQISDDPMAGGSWTWAEDYGTYGAYGSIGSGSDQAGQLTIDDDATGGKFVYLMGTIGGTRSVSSDTIRCTTSSTPILLRFPIDGGSHERFYPYGAGTWSTSANDCIGSPAFAVGLAAHFIDSVVYVGGQDGDATGWVRKVRDDDLNNFVWEHRVTNQAPRDLVADGMNHVYVAGIASGDGFVRKLTDSVTTVSSAWFESFSGLDRVEGIVLSADESRLFSVGTSDVDHVRIHSFDALGAASPTVAQLANATGTGTTTGVSIATDGASELYVSGKLEGSANFGSEELTATGSRAAYLASLDTGGNWYSFDRFDVGDAIDPPTGVVAGAAPTPEIEGVASPADYVYWDGSEAFPVRETPATLRLLWPATGGGQLEQIGLAVWPADPQLHMAGADVPLDSASHSFQQLHYSDGGDTSTDGDVFERAVEGFSTLRYEDGGGQTAFEVVRTIDFDGLGPATAAAVDIGTEILLPGHSRTDNAFLASALAPIDAAGPERAFDAPSRTGQILPVNVNGATAERQLRLVGYVAGSAGVRWPSAPYLYMPAWPSAPLQIVIKDQLGSETGGQPILLPSTHVSPRIYVQGDPESAGFNPNDEHALLLPSNQASGQQAVFALREQATTASEPYVLLKSRNPADSLRWRFDVYQVTESGTGDFTFDIEAGGHVPAPYPLALLGTCTETFAVDVSGSPYFEDVRGGVHARANGVMEVTYFYPLQSSFYYDPDLVGEDTGSAGVCVQFVDQAVEYQVSWPAMAPTLFVGETLIEPKRGLPDILHQAAVETAFQGSDTGLGPGTPSVEAAEATAIVKLFDALSPRWIEVPNDFPVDVLDRVPFFLEVRLEHDPVSIPNRLAFKGYYDASLVGDDPLLLPNVMSARERDLLLALSEETDWQEACEALFDLTRDPLGLSATEGELTLGEPADPDGRPSLLGAQGVVSAGAADTTGYVTVAFNNDASLDPAALPISLEVMRVDCQSDGGYYQGTVHTMPTDNVFDERLTLRHSGDFGGEPERFTFDWHYQLDEGGPPATVPPGMGWIEISPDNTQVDVTIQGANERTISDSWLLTRYQEPAGVCVQSAFTGDPSSTPTDPAPKLAEGWIKRVIRGLDPFRARTAAFHAEPTATYASLIEQAGEPYAGPVAFNGDPANVNQLGLIETYESVLRRGAELSIDAGINRESANTALLLAAGRVADLTMLLGNEAWADAQDPTIGFGTQSGTYGNLASSIFAFQNQLPDLLAEELALLRGRDGSNAPVNLFPVFHRLIWNIETGDVGEAAYSQVYDLRDRDLDGFIDAADARIQYPQGHGDAWGYYTSALGGYYRLLRHPDYEWVPRAEAVNVAGTAVPVDYRDERKFAAAAAARGRTGAEIASLTYRRDYVEDPSGQWQGYKDPDEDRGWGLSGWARRAGHGALFDWVTANALLPDDWQAPGAQPCPFSDDLDAFLGSECVDDGLVAGGYPEIGQIDRGNVPELAEISQQFGEVQSVLDEADAGLNPLGLARGVVPFDIDPSQIDPGGQTNQGRTHFEQIEIRAREALKGAVTVFDHANQLTQTLRRNQDSLVDFSRNVDDRERDLRNRLIEIFGYPYADDIGAGGTYPAGYDDADLYHYMVIDPSELIGATPGPTDTVTGFFSAIDELGYFIDPSHDLNVPSIAVDFEVDRNGLGIVKPDDWIGSRKAPGEAQRAISEYYQSVNLLDQAISAYDCLLADIESALVVLEAQFDLNAAEIDALGLDTIQTLNARRLALKRGQLSVRRIGETVRDVIDASIEGVPDGADDAGAPVKLSLAKLRAGQTALWQGIGDILEGEEFAAELALEEANAATDLDLATARGEFEVVQRLEALEQLIRAEPGLRLEVFNRREIVRQSMGSYQQVLARGLRLLEELKVLRKRTAADVQQHRYQDLAFRVARNDALQKYRAQFDLAARYVYLAASAYDYETNLLGTAGGAGREFLTDIVRQRSLGQLVNGEPQAGSRGLADPLARLGLNFQVIKGQLGFNNPQTETTRFSLRSELLRIRTDAGSDAEWRSQLERWRVDNLWDLPQFRRFARPFAPEPTGPCTATARSGCEPALVIGFEGNGGKPMSTRVVAGLNYFGHALGAGDSAYDATNFATRIRSAGVWLTGYETAGLSATPTVYVLPVGEDVLRSPTAGDFTARRWSVIDQVLPVPFPIGSTSLDDPLFIPINDSLSGVSGRLGDVRRLSSFRAYPDDGSFDPSQTTTNSRLIGRSVANTQWLIIIPGRTLLADPDEGLDRFLDNVLDVKLFFQTYAYSGN